MKSFIKNTWTCPTCGKVWAGFIVKCRDCEFEVNRYKHQIKDKQWGCGGMSPVKKGKL